MIRNHRILLHLYKHRNVLVVFLGLCFFCLFISACNVPSESNVDTSFEYHKLLVTELRLDNLCKMPCLEDLIIHETTKTAILDYWSQENSDQARYPICENRADELEICFWNEDKYVITTYLFDQELKTKLITDKTSEISLEMIIDILGNPDRFSNYQLTGNHGEVLTNLTFFYDGFGIIVTLRMEGKVQEEQIREQQGNVGMVKNLPISEIFLFDPSESEIIGVSPMQMVGEVDDWK